MTAYEQLRTRINELLPDRLKLEMGFGFGSEIVFADEAGGGDLEGVVISWPSGGYPIAVVWCEEIGEAGSMNVGLLREDHGKPLTIEDVLRAARVLNRRMEFSTDAVYEHGFKFGDHDRTRTIDLTKPLSAPENDAACAAVLNLLTV